MENKKPKILSIDYGFSSLKCCVRDSNGLIKFEKFISAAAKLPEKPLELDDNQVFQLAGEYYVLGSAALKVPRSYLFKLETFEDLKITYPIWLSYLINKYGGLKSFDKIVLGISLAFKDKTEELMSYLYETLNIDREHNDGLIFIFPQGLSCKKAYSEYGLDLREASKRNDIKMRNAILCDGGFETLDFCSIINGSSSAATAIGVKDTGIIRIVYDLIDYIYKTYSITCSVKEGQVILDTGVLKRRGRTIDLSKQVEAFSKKYIINVFKYLDENFGEVLDSIDDGIIILGGLSYFMKKYINDPEVAKEIEKVFSISEIIFPEEDGEYYNCLSYLRLTEGIIEKEQQREQ